MQALHAEHRVSDSLDPYTVSASQPHPNTVWPNGAKTTPTPQHVKTVMGMCAHTPTHPVSKDMLAGGGVRRSSLLLFCDMFL